MKFFGLLLYFVCLHYIAYSQDTFIRITSSDKSINLSESRNLLIYPDTIGNTDIEQITSSALKEKLVPIDSVKNLYSPAIKQYWAKFELKNQSNLSKFALSVDMWDFCAVYWQDSSLQWKKYESGVSFTFDQRPIQHWNRLIYLPLEIKPEQEKTFYILLKPKNTRAMTVAKTYNFIRKIILLDYEAADAKFRLSAYFFSFYLGVLSILVVYMFIFYFFVRDLSYLFFSIFLLHQAFLNIIESGFGIAFFYSNQPYLENAFFVYATRVTFVFLFLFTRHFLQLDKRLPRYNKAFIGIVAVLLSFWLIDLFLEVATSFSVILTLALGMLITFAANVQCIRQGYKPAIYLLFANIFYLSGFLMVIVMLRFPELVQKIPVLNLPFHVGSILQITFFAAGLGYRYNVMRREIEQHIIDNELLVRNQNVVLEQKIKEKTFELQEKAEELQTAYEEIQVSNEELHQTQEEILSQRDLVENKNILLEQSTHRIGKSIEAAKRIQKATLPSKEKMKEFFAENFVIFKPKDVVSGDFWWANQIENTKYLIVADCTGHGVSGAMLTMIGASLLDRIILVLGITEPSEILEKLHSQIQKALQQEKSKNSEGMDIAVICWYEENEEYFLSFSAAKRPLYFVSDRKIEKLAGSKKMIGGFWKNTKSFETKTLILPTGTTLYLSSDGFADQNNVERNTFSEKRLLNLLEEIQDLPMGEQKEILKNQLASHMKGTEQRDDILLVGVRI